jgi:hypothetical protein
MACSACRQVHGGAVKSGLECCSSRTRPSIVPEPTRIQPLGDDTTAKMADMRMAVPNRVAGSLEMNGLQNIWHLLTSSTTPDIFR